MTTRSWLDDEPRPSACLLQAARLLYAGARRPAAVLAGTAILLASLLAIRALQKHAYTPRFVFRVVETDSDPRNHPRPRRDLADYVQNGVFTSGPLLDIIHRYGLYPGLARRSARAALEAFREDIDIDVYRNYFVEERSADSAPRSARLAISYKNADRNLAVSVTRALGTLVAERELAARRDLASHAAEAAQREVDAGREVLESRQLELAAKRAALDRMNAPDPGAEVELAELAASADRLAMRQDEAEKHDAELTVGAALESRGLGLSFEVVDDAALPAHSERAEVELAIFGSSFLLGLPLVFLAVGAFVPRRGTT